MTVNELNISGDQLRVMLESGFILREAARFDDAETIFRGVIEFLPESEVPVVGLGTVFLQRGDFEMAAETCERAVEINPESLYARVHYGEALLFSKQRERAEEVLGEIIERDPASPHSKTAKALLGAADLIAPEQNFPLSM